MIANRMSRHIRRVRERIQRLNPHGIAEGSIPRGWNPHQRSWRFEYDAMPVGAFIRKFGRDLFRSLPLDAIIKPPGAGRRKLVTREAMKEIGL